jgi:hypothetical protein
LSGLQRRAVRARTTSWPSCSGTPSARRCSCRPFARRGRPFRHATRPRHQRHQSKTRQRAAERWLTRSGESTHEFSVVDGGATTGCTQVCATGAVHNGVSPGESVTCEIPKACSSQRPPCSQASGRRLGAPQHETPYAGEVYDVLEQRCTLPM